jgi:hypothetical protein
MELRGRSLGGCDEGEERRAFEFYSSCVENTLLNRSHPGLQ